MMKTLRAYSLLASKSHHTSQDSFNSNECFLVLLIVNSITAEEHYRVKRFTCPSDGKWPDPVDCGKWVLYFFKRYKFQDFKKFSTIRFYTCQGGSASGGWCGPGMSFDVENQRCEMALAINCKDGERPDWKAPDGCKNKLTSSNILI